MQALLRTWVQLLRTQIKIKTHICNPGDGIWEKQAVSLISPANQGFKLTGRPHLNKWRAKQSMKETRYQPLASTCTTLYHTKTCASIYMKKKKENKHLRCTQEQGQIMTRLTSFQQHSPQGTLFLVHDSQLVKWSNVEFVNKVVLLIKVYTWDKTIYRCWHIFKAKVR